MPWGVALTVIICEDRCKDCDINFIKDPSNLGDYNEEGKLLRWCDRCGKMLPVSHTCSSEIDTRDIISNGLKKRVGTRFAKRHSLDYRLMSGVVKSLKHIEKKSEFVIVFSIRVEETFGIKINKTHFDEII